MGKSKLFIFLFAFVFLLSLSFVSADLTDANVTIVSPSASSTATGSLILNSTITASDGAGYTTANFYAKSASTANSTWTLLASTTNDTSDDVFNATFDTTLLEDANDYIFNVTINNGTNNISTTNSGITIDNTIPQAPSLSPSTNTVISSSTTQTFTGTVTDENTTSCTYTIYRGGSASDSMSESGSCSYSGTSCTFTKSFTSTLYNGEYYWTITASDGTNSTASSTNQISIQLPGSGGASETFFTEEESLFKSDEGKLVIVILIIVGIVGLIYLGTKYY